MKTHLTITLFCSVYLRFEQSVNPETANDLSTSSSLELKTQINRPKTRRNRTLARHPLLRAPALYLLFTRSLQYLQIMARPRLLRLR